MLYPATSLVDGMLQFLARLETNCSTILTHRPAGQAYTVEEVKERQAELSKMRALMFYQERKQHHMNKIKSKVSTSTGSIITSR